MGPEESVLSSARELDSHGRFSEITELAGVDIPICDQPEMDFYLGKSYFALGEFEEAEARLSRSLSALTPGSNLKLYIQAALYLGACFLRMNDYPESIIRLNMAASLFETIPENDKDDELLKFGTQIYFYLAQNLRFENNYEEAIRVLFNALTLCEKSGDQADDRAPILLEIGVNCNLAKKYKQAESLLQAAIELLNDNAEENKYLIADLKQQLGLSLLKQNRVNPAIEAFTNALMVYSESHEAAGENAADIASAQFMLGICYLRQRNHREADKYLQQALAVFSNPNLPFDELKQACAFIKWVAQDERANITLTFQATHNNSSFRKLEKVLEAINRFDIEAGACLDKIDEAYSLEAGRLF
ncbi:tetratricopeptide repeat protein [Legionella micdadei]|uniref:TPR repeat-containing protein n=1 Tax=Legionella micdadei TaxID=451 RepID=A0A098GE03_LEGMI|nr:tetratricopeptide repeat protein [Legionella micdadei]ARG97703.1 hypothetical protein B6N58_08530 [Legionella micdadei]ARG99983.1 hypothetical protein B6V88_05885 [Legionella micdadei]KTD27799.1 Tetratricopeptide repeat protein [Legionella micdadei]NSL17782.1 tetratricopeptide repeat protein [Legionella micdadei]CEG60714.1 protein of unknown function [Tetratricopeptide repeat] [Legionella micdadei]